MGIDFSSLVLAPAMATFAKPVLIVPQVSQPNAAPYSARGIWTVQEQTLVSAEDTFTSTSIVLGIRWVDFPATGPAEGDMLHTSARNLPLGYWQGQIDPDATIEFMIDAVTPDGQGGAKITLKRIVSTL